MHDSDSRNDAESASKNDETSTPERRSGLINWCRTKLYDHLIEPLVESRNPPWYDARGVAVGVIVGFGAPVGAHAASICLLRLTLRFNIVVALAFTWVCNPFNVIFLYYGYYRLGSLLLGKPANMSFHLFRKLIYPIVERGHFWQALSEFMQLSEDMLVRWFVAAALVAAVCGLIAYFLTRRIQTRRCKKAALKMGIEYEMLVKELEEKVAASNRS